LSTGTGRVGLRVAELLRLHGPWTREERRADDDQLFRRALSIDDAARGDRQSAPVPDLGRRHRRGRSPRRPRIRSRGRRDRRWRRPGAAGTRRARIRRCHAPASPFRHRSTLLHYGRRQRRRGMRQLAVAAERRRKSRASSSTRARTPTRTCPCYGEDDTPMGLLVTSAHPPWRAYRRRSSRCGAPPARTQNGPRTTTARRYGRPAPLAIRPRWTRSSGVVARLDNLVLAAAAGDLAAVCANFDGAGRLEPMPTWGRARIPGGKLDVSHVLEYALIQAALHGRRAVVEFLLTKNPDPEPCERPNWNATALGAARWANHGDVVALIEPLMPP